VFSTLQHVLMLSHHHQSSLRGQKCKIYDYMNINIDVICCRHNTLIVGFLFYLLVNCVVFWISIQKLLHYTKLVIKNSATYNISNQKTTHFTNKEKRKATGMVSYLQPTKNYNFNQYKGSIKIQRKFYHNMYRNKIKATYNSLPCKEWDLTP
jgi:hypothetical protein